MSKILIVVASVNKNMELAQTLASEVESQGAAPEIVDLVELGLPLFTSIREGEEGVPKTAGELSARMASARGLIFVAPEYNGGIPPVLTNAFAWISRSGDDWRAGFNGKLAAIATHAGGGGLHVLAAMRVQLSYLGVTVLGRQLQTNFNKPLNPESATAVVKQLLALTAP